jgi:hypothetical protein
MTLKILRGNLTLICGALDGGAILSPQEAADMDDLEDTQYRLEKELEELRPIRAFVRMGDGTAAEAPVVMDEATPT